MAAPTAEVSGPADAAPAPAEVRSPARGVSHHAQGRALERLGFLPTAEQWAAAIAAMTTGRGALLVSRLPDAEVWRVAIGPAEANVVWSPETRTVVTVRPPGANHAGHVRARLSHNGIGAPPIRSQRANWKGGRKVRFKEVWR